MRRSKTATAVSILVVLALTGTARARTAQEWSGQSDTDVHVAPWGVDDPGCGSSGRPCRTIARGIANASAGDTVRVRAGTYTESWVHMKSGVRVLSADGPLRASIHSGGLSAVRFTGVSGAEIDGFEIHGDLNQGPLGDGLVRIDDARDVTVRNSMIHDAPADCARTATHCGHGGSGFHALLSAPEYSFGRTTSTGQPA
jgi:hypothetical protein